MSKSRMSKTNIVILSATFSMVLMSAGSDKSKNDSVPSVKAVFSSVSLDGKNRELSTSSRSILDWFRPKKPQPQPQVKPNPTQPQPSEIVKRIVQLHNDERSKKRLNNLSINDKLSVASQRQSDDIAIRDRLNSDLHQGNNGSSPWQRINSVGYQYTNASENAAAGWPDTPPSFPGTNFTPDVAMDGWMNSSGHRANILGNYREIGVGVSTAKSGRIYYVTDFGSPR